MNRKFYSLKKWDGEKMVAKPSNAQRMRDADAAVLHAKTLEGMLVELVNNRNGLQATLCSVLAQKGGEVTITPGTMAQLAETPVSFVIVAGPGEGEFTLRLVIETGEANASDTDNESNDGSAAPTGAEGETVETPQTLSAVTD